MEIIDYNDNFFILKSNKYEIYWHKMLKNFESHMRATEDEFFNPENPSNYFFRYEPHSNDVVFDIGACEGMFGYLTKDRVKEAHLFEPVQLHCCAMKHTFKNDANVTIHNIAFSDHSYTDIYAIDPNGCMGCAGSGSNNPNDITNEVDVVSLDDFVDSTNIIPSVIKVDIEGHEMEFLKGAVTTIKTYHPTIIICTYHLRNDIDIIPKFLLDCGYSIYYGKTHYAHAFIDSTDGRKLFHQLYMLNIIRFRMFNFKLFFTTWA